MTTWLCRLMAAVFTINVLAPTDLLAQTQTRRPSSAASRVGQMGQIPSNEDIRAQVEEKFKDTLSAARTQYEEAKGVAEMYAAVWNLHAVMDQLKGERSRRQASADQQRQLQEELKNSYVAVQDNTRVAREHIITTKPDLMPNFDDFAALINNGTISIQDLLTYLDPLEDDSWMYTVFAAEIFGNSVDVMGQNEEDLSPEMIDFLLELQLRAIYRLQNLLDKKIGSSAYIMAVNSLRTLLLKVNDFFKRTGIQNPLFEQTVSSVGSGSGQKMPSSLPQSLYRVGTGDAVRFTASSPSVGKGKGSSKSQAPILKFSETMYHFFMNSLMSELREYKEKDLSENDAEYPLLLLTAQYAASYAMLFDPSYITSMVALFDKGPKKTDFKQQYSSVLNAILTTVFESVKFTPGNDKHTQAIQMFAAFSDPQKYSIPTRIFALEMASLLYRPHDPMQLFSANGGQKMDVGGVLSNMFVVNTSSVDENLRPVFAMRAVDIYGPLNKTHPLAMQDYGLDSQQMQALADKMAYIYNGFANDELKWDTSRSRDRRSYVLDRAEDGHTLILNKGNSVPRLVDITHGYQFQLPDGSLSTISGFGYSSRGWWEVMNLRNGINSKKRSDEYSKAFVMFVGEAILWVFGGEIIGIAWRVTRGAMVALPKAVRAASLANKGSRVLSFGNEIRNGVRYANLAYTTRLNGITVQAVRTEKVRKTAEAASTASKAASAAAEAAPANALRLAPPPVTSASASGKLLNAAQAEVPLLGSAGEAATSGTNWWSRMWNRFRSPWAKEYTEERVASHVASMKDFRNSRGLWRGSRAPVEEWIVSVQQPGFSFESAILTGPKATRLRNGIKNWEDWTYLMENAVTAEGTALNFTTPLKPWRSLLRSTWKPMFGMTTPEGLVQQEQRILGATGRAFAKDAEKGLGEGVFDYWKYTEKGWTRVSQKDFMELGEGMQAAAKEAVPDYYAVLGLERNASAAQIKRSYRELALRFHSDKGGTDAVMSKLNEAWKVLGNKKAKAAYDVQLAAAPKNPVVSSLAKSPEGSSLAITRNMGREVPAGFSPLSEGGRGLGFNAENWREVDLQLARHLSETQQTTVLGKSLVIADPLIGGTAGNMAFFGAWAGLDEAVNPVMQNWIAATSTKSIEELQQEYGDAYDPALMAKDQEENEKALRDMKEQGYNTATPSVYDDVVAAERPSSMGALISFPLLGAWHGLSKINLINEMGMNSPFKSKQTKTILELGAQRIQVQRMVSAYQKVKNQQDFDTFYKNVMDVVAQSEASYTQAFNDLAKQGVSIKAERKAIMSYFNSVKRSLQQIASGKEELNDKVEKINQLWESFSAKIPELEEQLVQKMGAEVESTYFSDLSESYKEMRDNYEFAFLSQNADSATMDKLRQILQAYADKLNGIQKKPVSFTAKQQQVQDMFQAMNEELNALYYSLGGVTAAQTASSAQDLYQQEMQTLAEYEYYASMKGIKQEAFFQAWRKRVENLCQDETYSVKTLSDALDLERTKRLQELEKLLPAASSDETGFPMQDGLDELLPEVTSAISTGA